MAMEIRNGSQIGTNKNKVGNDTSQNGGRESWEHPPKKGCRKVIRLKKSVDSHDNGELQKPHQLVTRSLTRARTKLVAKTKYSL